MTRRLVTARATRRQEQAVGWLEVAALKLAVTVALGSKNPLLVQFGFAKKSATPLIAQQKTLRAAKAS